MTSLTVISCLFFLFLDIKVSIRPFKGRITPQARHWYFLLIECSLNCFPKLEWDKLFFATTNSPLVSLSILWTIPGLVLPLTSESLFLYLYISALTNVFLWFPAPGCTTIPLGLFIIKRSLSSNIISNLILFGIIFKSSSLIIFIIILSFVLIFVEGEVFILLFNLTLFFSISFFM